MPPALSSSSAQWIQVSCLIKLMRLNNDLKVHSDFCMDGILYIKIIFWRRCWSVTNPYLQSALKGLLMVHVEEGITSLNSICLRHSVFHVMSQTKRTEISVTVTKILVLCFVCYEREWFVVRTLQHCPLLEILWHRGILFENSLLSISTSLVWGSNPVPQTSPVL